MYWQSLMLISGCWLLDRGSLAFCFLQRFYSMKIQWQAVLRGVSVGVSLNWYTETSPDFSDLDLKFYLVFWPSSSNNGRYTVVVIVVDYILIKDKGCCLWDQLHAFDSFDSVVISKLMTEPSVTSYQSIFWVSSNSSHHSYFVECICHHHQR